MSILFLGPLPPPVHGFSAINQAMLEELKKSSSVIVFNRAPPSRNGNASRWQQAVQSGTHWLRLLAKFAAASVKRPEALYAGFSGGKGQLLDLPFFVVARLAGIPTYVHHHSFAYLNQPSKLTAVCMKVLSQARHIALCPEMASGINSTYNIPLPQLTVLSNAAFLPSLPQGQGQDSAPSAGANPPPVRLGFLSNITAEKGIFEFFALVRQAQKDGLRYHADIAGPVDPGIANQFQTELATLANTRHLGPLYGEDKQRFFQSIDLLLFPTRYQNEAEPVTLHEALQAGAMVVANNRGCIGGMLPDHCGAARPADEFVPQALQALSELNSLTAEERRAKRLAIQDHYEHTAHLSRATLTQLVHAICQTPRQQP